MYARDKEKTLKSLLHANEQTFTARLTQAILNEDSARKKTLLARYSNPESLLLSKGVYEELRSSDECGCLQSERTRVQFHLLKDVFLFLCTRWRGKN